MSEGPNAAREGGVQDGGGNLEGRNQEVTATCCFNQALLYCGPAEEGILKIYKPEKDSLKKEVIKSDYDWLKSSVYKDLCRRWDKKDISIKYKTRKITTRSDKDGTTAGYIGSGPTHHFLVLDDTWIVQFIGVENIYEDGEIKLERYNPKNEDHTMCEMDDMTEDQMVRLEAALGVISYSLTSNNCQFSANFIYFGRWWSDEVFDSALVRRAIMNGTHPEILTRLGVIPNVIRKELEGFEKDYFPQRTGDPENIIVFDAGPHVLERLVNRRKISVFTKQKKVPHTGFIVERDLTLMLPARNKPKDCSCAERVNNNAFIGELLTRVKTIRGVIVAVENLPSCEPEYAKHDKLFKKTVPFLILINTKKVNAKIVKAWHARKGSEGAVSRLRGLEYGRLIEVIEYEDDSRWSREIGSSEMIKAKSIPTLDAINWP